MNFQELTDTVGTMTRGLSDDRNTVTSVTVDPNFITSSPTLTNPLTEFVMEVVLHEFRVIEETDYPLRGEDGMTIREWVGEIVDHESNYSWSDVDSVEENQVMVSRWVSDLRTLHRLSVSKLRTIRTRLSEVMSEEWEGGLVVEGGGTGHRRDVQMELREELQTEEKVTDRFGQLYLHISEDIRDMKREVDRKFKEHRKEEGTK